MALIRGSEGLLAHSMWTAAGNTGRKGGPPSVCEDLLLGHHAVCFVYLVACTFSTPVQECTHPVSAVNDLMSGRSRAAVARGGLRAHT